MNIDVYNLFKELDAAKLAIDKAKNKISYQAEKINDLQTRNERQPYFYKFKIIKDILLLICRGYDELNAVNEVAELYKGILKRDSVHMLWRASRHDRNAINLYARAYMAKKMRSAGFKISEIAITMGLSRTSINKLLKKEVMLDS